MGTKVGTKMGSAVAANDGSDPASKAGSSTKDLLDRLGENRKGMAEHVAHHLIERIVSGELPPGSHLVEATIARELGISKTPVREAIKTLPDTGLVEVFPYRGAFVREVTPRFLDEVGSLRARLEAFAATLALPHLREEDFALMLDIAREMDVRTQQGDHLGTVELDVRFHSLLYERSQHGVLQEMWARLLPRVELLQAYGRIQASPLPAGHVERRHHQFVDVLRAGDPEAITREIEEHIRMGQTMAITKRQGNA